MKRMETFDVGFIGVGIHGASAAFHGFKLAPSLGRRVADLMTGGAIAAITRVR
jgi:hypothetical protein